MYQLTKFCFLLITLVSALQSRAQVLPVVTDTIHFGSMQSHWRASSEALLFERLQALKANPAAMLHIHAYADAEGTMADRHRLATRRGENIYLFLRKYGIARTRMKVKIHASEAPHQCVLLSTHLPIIAEKNTPEVPPAAASTPPQKIEHAHYAGEAKYAALELQVHAGDTDMPLPARVLLQWRGGKDNTRTTEKGIYKKRFEMNTYVEVSAHAPGYFFESTRLQLTLGQRSKVRMRLHKAEVGDKVTLDNLLFEPGKADLLPDSEGALQRLLHFMQGDPNVRIEIGGHVNVPFKRPVRQSSSHFRLSLNRAMRVFSFLVENGIAENRMTYKGYGNWEMIHPKARTLEEEQKNRRVEIKITAQ